MSNAKVLTGRKVLAIAVAAFGLVIGANIAMMMAATGTFPGLVVQNSYVASQRWQAETDAQAALGWRAQIVYRDDALTVSLRDRDGAPVAGLGLAAAVGRPTDATDDHALVLGPAGDGYAAPVHLAPGAWRVELRTTDGPAYRVGATLIVPEQNGERG